MQIRIQSEVSEVLQYVAALKGELVDDLVGAIVEEWLDEHYCESVDRAEKRLGLKSTILSNGRGRLDERAAYENMTANLAVLQ